MPEWLPTCREFGELILTGYNFKIGKLAEGEKAFSNRGYVWGAVPVSLRNRSITRAAGGAEARITVTAKAATTVEIATALPTPETPLSGWTQTGARFHYSDQKKTTLFVFTRSLQKGEAIELPRIHWTGTLVLLPAGSTVSP